MDDENGIVIEPLSNEEKRDQGATSVQNNPENDADYPKDWRGKPIAEIVGKGFKYHKRVQRNGKTYMVLRRGRHDKGLGLWSQEKEDKLFGYYPNLAFIGDLRPAPPLLTQLGPTPGRSALLSVPIRRIAVIPRDFIPTIDVIRYFQIMKHNGFTGDFSQFVNDIIIEHFVRCHGIVLPVLLRETMENEQNV